MRKIFFFTIFYMMNAWSMENEFKKFRLKLNEPDKNQMLQEGSAPLREFLIYFFASDLNFTPHSTLNQTKAFVASLPGLGLLTRYEYSIQNVQLSFLSGAEFVSYNRLGSIGDLSYEQSLYWVKSPFLLNYSWKNGLIPAFVFDVGAGAAMNIAQLSQSSLSDSKLFLGWSLEAYASMHFNCHLIFKQNNVKLLAKIGYGLGKLSSYGFSHLQGAFGIVKTW